MLSGTETYVSIEYEASSTFDLQNVVISVPLPTLREAPNVKQNDGEWRYDSRNSILQWSILLIDNSNRSGSMEFVVPPVDASVFFPISVRFTAASTFSELKGMYVLSNVASGNEFHKEAVMDQLFPQIGDNIQSIMIKLLQSNDTRLRTACVWTVLNLTFPSSPGAHSRVAKLQNACITSQLKDMVNDPCLDVKGQSENPEVSVERSNAQLDTGVGMGKLDDEHEVVFGLSFLQQETIPSLETNSNESHIDQLGSGGECSSPLDGPIKSGSSISAIYTSSKPDFSKLKGEICLDNLSVRELHETFKATFGRETSVKDKQWLRRRIAMGLANSCDVPTTTFVIKDNKVVKKGKEESFKSVDHTPAKVLSVGVNENCGGSPIG
ncbi:unnamed protein product [Camellia sinensis]